MNRGLAEWVKAGCNVFPSAQKALPGSDFVLAGYFSG